MALRTPTDYALTYDEQDLHPGQPIYDLIPDDIIDSQMYVQRRVHLVSTACWYPVEIDAGTWTLARTVRFIAPDSCDGTGQGVPNVAIKAWSDDGSTNFDLRLYDTNALLAVTVSVTSSQTSKIWRGPFGVGLNMGGDGYVDDYTVDAQRTAGSGKIYVAGLGVWV